MLASQAGRRALAAMGIGLASIGVTGGPAGAVELPPVTVPEVTVATLPTVEDPPVTVPSLLVETTVPTVVARAPGPTTTVAAPPPTPAPPVTVSAPAAVPAAAPAPAPAPAAPAATPPAGATADVVASPPLRAVASQRARQFAFPFTLVLAVIGFLAVQHRVGRNDPRLVAAPIDDDRRLFR